MTTSFTLLKAYDHTIVGGVKQSKPANRDCRLYLVLTIGRGEQQRFKTDLMINATKWDFDRQQVRPQVADSVRINRRLTELKSNVLEAYNKLMDSETKPTFDELCEKISHVVKTGTLPTPPPDKVPLTFFQSFSEYQKFKKLISTHRTSQKISTVRKALKEFESKSGEITFDAVNLSFYRKFRAFLHTRTNIMTGEKGYRADTVSKYIEGLKAFMKWSSEEGHHNNIEYTKKEFSSSRSARQEIVTLSEQEVNQLMNHDFSTQPHLDRVRDLFVFMCFTGQRISDIMNFDPKQVVEGVWRFKAEKTKKPIQIPLIGFAKPAADVLAKYNGDLPKMVEQVFNRSIKDVGRSCGITEGVTIERIVKEQPTFITKPKCEFMSSHMGRRTLVTILANRGVPLTTIQEITGHDEIKTLMKYKRKDPDLIREAFETLAEPEQQGRTLRAV